MSGSTDSCTHVIFSPLTSAVIWNKIIDTTLLLFEEGRIGDTTYAHIEIDPAKFSFEILSQEDGKKLMSQKPLLLVNGGFVDASGEPCGLLISHGRELSPFSSEQKYSGVFVIHDGKALITRSEDFNFTENTNFALQNGPLIIEPGGRPGIKPNATDKAKRTVLALDKEGRIHFFFVKGPISLYGCQNFLLNKVKNIDAALNLDGGPMTFFKLDMFGQKASFGSAESLTRFIKITPVQPQKNRKK